MAEVNMDSLKPNSHRYKNEEANKEKDRLKPVINKEDVVSTKESLGKKMVKSFVKEDIQDVKRYILLDVVIPGIKNTVLDMLQMAFFGEVRDRRSSGYGRSSDREHYSYSARYRGSSYSNSSSRRDSDYRSDDKVDYKNIVLRNRTDAEEVVEQLRYRIRETGKATIGDLFDLMDLAGRYVDNDWGWTDERDIGIRRISSGFLIDVAEARYVG